MVLLLCIDPGTVKFMLRDRTYLNNSVVTINDIGEGDNDALLCVTELEDCCMDPRHGDFYYPNGTRVPFAMPDGQMRKGLLRNRGNQVIRLIRKGGMVTSPTGQYRCVIPDNLGVNQTIYINSMRILCACIIFDKSKFI